MRTPHWSRIARPSVAITLGILITGAAGATSAADEASQPAQWTQKEFQFIYQGFTTHYSCDGLRDKVDSIVRQLGARKDSKVYELGCTASYGRPDPFPGVRAKISVLQPLAPAEASNPKDPSAVVPAHWKRVKLRLDADSLSEAGECELVEQVKQHILPLFITRNIEFKPDCIPHQLTPGGTTLSADVLVPDEKPASVAARG
ncbi:MAG TPA: hypothetical protein VNU73_08555 [Steroidobacteraceae bacterium]|jgi:hypothetical protein|nr:hypothetical protein [Steroidobacteraceae bacterium]